MAGPAPGLGLARARSALTLEGQRELLGRWLDKVPPGRLVACCWEFEEVEEVSGLGVHPMAVLEGLDGGLGVLEALRPLPAETWVYSHPQYTSGVLSPAGLPAPT